MQDILSKKTLADVILDNKTVIVRVDFNVPIKDGVIQDNKRIAAAIPTIEYLIKHNCKIILLSHLSRIKSIDDIKSNKKSLKPVASELAKLINDVNVTFIPTSTGQLVTDAVKLMKPKDVILLENTRYNDVNANGEVVKLESKCDNNLGKEWASLAEVFVNDAFGTSHRKHASNVGIANNIETSCIGLLIQKEIKNLSRVVNNPVRPVVAILGGAKVSDKLKVIDNLLNIADKILICGGMAYTFLKAQGIDIGTSLYEPEMLDSAKQILAKGSDKINVSIDFMCGETFADVKPIYRTKEQGLAGVMGLDIGKETIKLFTKQLQNAGTVFWNGPCGVFEFNNFQEGTKAICECLKNLTVSHGTFTLIGGGDSATAIVTLGYSENDYSFISTGGGASLEFIEGSPLPGIECIQNK